MAISSFVKQPWEQFYIAADFSLVLGDAETIDGVNSEITAADYDGNDLTTDLIEAGSEQVDGDYYKVRCKGGVDKTNYKITFRAVTSLDNQYELDVRMKVKEL